MEIILIALVAVTAMFFITLMCRRLQKEREFLVNARAEYEKLMQESNALQLSAARWEAVINCARIRGLGHAGLNGGDTPAGEPYDGYAHVGLELWTKHPRVSGERGREWLTKFADIAIEEAKKS